MRRFLHRAGGKAQEIHLSLEREKNLLRSVVDGMREGVLVVDEQGLAHIANPAFRVLFNVAGEAEGRSPLELTASTQLEDLIVKSLQSEEEHRIEIELWEPIARNLSVACFLLPDAGAVVVARDITKLVRLTETRRDFVANVSHELKTPLSAIRGYAETLIDGAVEDKPVADRFLSRILQQCNRLQVLLEDLLTLSRLESLEKRTKLRMVYLVPVIRDCIEAVTPRLEAKGITIEAELDDDTTIMADREAIERMISNLLENGTKYNETDGRIAIRLTQDSEVALIEVTDTGIGIPESSLPRVFERFYRVDSARSREEGGTGLGLAIVKHAAQLHGGRVEVQSKLGQGSTFRVYIPKTFIP